MKKPITLVLLFLSATLFAQVPQGIKYQVVVRDNNGIPLPNKSLSLQVSLLEDSPTGLAGYVETHATSTNEYGMVNISIGTGTPVQGTMAGLMWDRHSYFAKIEVDTAGGSIFELLGISQLLTLPYAFHAGSSSMPSMTTGERDAITNPYPGMTILNSNSNCLNVYTGASWYQFCGEELCTGNITDNRDGQTYPIVKIGNQCWMAKNLNIGTYVVSNFTGSSHSDVSNNGIIEKYCYGNSAANCDVYGGLYDWDEMMVYSTKAGVQGICPSGWHIPADWEWTILVDYLIANGYNFDGTTSDNKIAKALSAEAGWDASTFTGTPGNTDYQGYRNKSGFTAFPGGLRNNYGRFYDEGYGGLWWSSSVYVRILTWYRRLFYNGQYLDRGMSNRAYGFSVRCCRD